MISFLYLWYHLFHQRVLLVSEQKFRLTFYTDSILISTSLMCTGFVEVVLRHATNFETPPRHYGIFCQVSYLRSNAQAIPDPFLS